MKRHLRLSLLIMFVIVLLQVTTIQAQFELQDSVNHGSINFSVERIGIGDVDGNGADDLVFINIESGLVSTGVSFSDGRNFSRQTFYDQTRWSGGTVGGTMFIEDVNGDRNDDILFSTHQDGVNNVTVFLSRGDGTFSDAVTQKVGSGGFSDYRRFGGDVNGDGRFDLIYNNLTHNGSENITYVALAQSNGTFILQQAQNHGSGFQQYWTTTGDVNGDGRADVVWTETNGDSLYFYYARGLSDGRFVLQEATNDPDLPSAIVTLLDDVDCDGDGDIIYQDSSSSNRSWVYYGNGNGNFSQAYYQKHSDAGWENYILRHGNVNTDRGVDLVFVEVGNPTYSYVAFGCR